MRTTLNLDEELHGRLKRLAAATGRTLTELLEDAIRGLLEDVDTASQGPPLVLPSFDGGERPGLLPGVDLADNASLQDAMERPDGAAA